MTDPNSASLIGHPASHLKSNIAEGNENLFNQVLEDRNIPTSNLNARQTFHKLKQDQQPTEKRLPLRCTLKPPEQINVYTDGSWLFPLKQFLGLGGAGVWWPGRQQSPLEDGQRCHPLSPAEFELAFDQQSEDGLRLYTNIGGYGGSSTRTELAAGLIAICAHGLVHVGSDSRSFVDTANTILQDILEHRKPQKPWKLVSDGDLWEFFHQAVTSKGASSIRISWIKGHATQAHIADGVTTLQDKLGNDEADKVADIGAALFGQDLMLAAKCLQKRHKEYQTFMCDISHHIIEAYLIHRELVKQQETIQLATLMHTDKKKPYCPLAYPSPEMARSLVATSCLMNYTMYTNKHSASKHIEHFLANLQVVPCNGSIRGITWLELYILYRCRGYHKPIANPGHAAKLRATPAKQIRAFKKHVRGIVCRSLQDSTDACLFRPSPPMMDALIGVGITGKHATLNLNVALNQQEQDAIAQWLTKITRTISNKFTKEYILGDRNLVPNQLKLNGKVSWDCTIPILTHEISIKKGWEVHRRIMMNTHSNPTLHFLNARSVEWSNPAHAKHSSTTTSTVNTDAHIATSILLSSCGNADAEPDGTCA